jgi:hypothetical protein
MNEISRHAEDDMGRCECCGQYMPENLLGPILNGKGEEVIACFGCKLENGLVRL